MKVNELSKELKITNKELITFLKDNGFNISSHMQPVSDEMIDMAREKLTSKVEHEVTVEKVDDIVAAPVESHENKNINEELKPTKTFKPDDIIVCRSVTASKMNALGVDRHTVYHWENYGDVDYLTYRDLQALRRTEYVTKPLFIIEDADLCYQWRRELGDTYKYFIGVEYPEEFFDKSDSEFTNLLEKAPDVVKEVIKVTALNMIKNENYPTVQKLSLIDSILGTCLKEFL